MKHFVICQFLVLQTMYQISFYQFFRYALGESAMRHLRAASVLISGLGSVGAEIAKNLILGGIRRVTIHDTRCTTWRDLSAQVTEFFRDLYVINFFILIYFFSWEGKIFLEQLFKSHSVFNDFLPHKVSYF